MAETKTAVDVLARRREMSGGKIVLLWKSSITHIPYAIRPDRVKVIEPNFDSETGVMISENHPTRSCTVITADDEYSVRGSVAEVAERVFGAGFTDSPAGWPWENVGPE